MLNLIAWDVTLKIRGPVLTTSSAPLEFGIDAPFARNAAGEYYLAGSLVKGRLKEAWKEMEGAAPDSLCQWDWKRWLGKDPSTEKVWDSVRGVVHFADFIYTPETLSKDKEEAKTLYRIRRDDATEAVAFGQNLMISTPFLSNGLYPFKGRVWTIMNNTEAQRLHDSLIRGFSWIPSVGADHTVGFGVIQDVDVKRLEQSDYVRSSGFETAPSADALRIAIQPDGPLCIGGKRIAENIFESTQIIPGGVIKGAISDAILRVNRLSEKDVALLVNDPRCEMKELCEHFSKIRVLHARPVRKGVRKLAMAIPASAAKRGERQQIEDVAFRDLVQDEVGLEFQIDWKSGAQARELCGIVEAPFELRVRTQIDGDKRRAKDENLFAYRMTAARGYVPRNEVDGGGVELASFEWLTVISFDAIVGSSARANTREQICKLFAKVGIPGIGKLKTHCAVERIGAVTQLETIPESHEKDASVWVITLQTPALLCDIEDTKPGLSSAFETYRAYWNSVSGGALDLQRHFASQYLAGGEYQWHHLSGASAYRPFVLTDAGAVFVLRASEDDRQKAIKEIDYWKMHGLPVAPSVMKSFGLKGDDSDWHKCPYIRQNGYGEVAVDLDWHWKEVR